jgi:hypothetical protein
MKNQKMSYVFTYACLLLTKKIRNDKKKVL